MASIGRIDDAVNASRRAIRLDPAYAAAWHGLGVRYLQKRNFAKALIALNKAVALDPKSVNAWTSLVVLHSLRQDQPALRTALARLRKLDRAAADSLGK